MDTRGEKSSSTRKPQMDETHTPAIEHDLNPDHLAGQNIGSITDRQVSLPTAYDRKDVQRILADFNDEDLKHIPILSTGTRLEQGAVYVDLLDEQREEFKTAGAASARDDQLLVPKDRVPYWIWNRLIHEEKPGQG
jgi:hypothetical protein